MTVAQVVPESVLRDEVPPVEKSAEKSAENPLRACKHRGFCVSGPPGTSGFKPFGFNNLQLKCSLINDLSLLLRADDPQVPHFSTLGPLAGVKSVW